jgi:hypothetical protein
VKLRGRFSLSKNEAATASAGGLCSQERNGMTSILDGKNLMNIAMDCFTAPITPGPTSVQIRPPTEQETLEANGHMRRAYESLGLTFIDIPTVAVA